MSCSRDLAILDPCPAVRAGMPLLLPSLDQSLLFPSLAPLLKESFGRLLVVSDPWQLEGSDFSVQRGTEIIAALVRLGHVVAVYSAETRPLVLARAARAGAAGFGTKHELPTVLTKLLDADFGHGLALSPSLEPLRGFLSSCLGLPELSDRQEAVLRMRGRGMAWGNIAKQICVTDSVAREHLAVAMRKFSTVLPGATATELAQALGLL